MDIPMVHAGPFPMIDQVVIQQLRERNRTVMATCAANRNDQLAFPLFALQGNHVINQRQPMIQKTFGFLPAEYIIPDIFI